MSDLPKKFHGGVAITAKEKKALEAWAIRENWSRQKSIDKQFPLGMKQSLLDAGFGNAMPNNLVAPGIPDRNWSGRGKCVCVMCGYVTTVTNVHRQCSELPADDEMNTASLCYTHGEEVHFVERDGKKIPTVHRGIAMVCVS